MLDFANAAVAAAASTFALFLLVALDMSQELERPTRDACPQAHRNSLLPPFLLATVSLPSKLNPVKPTVPPSLLNLYLLNASRR